MGAGAPRVHRHRHGHVDHVELVNRFHAHVGKAQHLGVFDGFGHEVGRAAHGHQVSRLVLLDGFDGDGAALGLADHGDQPGLAQHHFGEAVHAGGGGGTGGAHGLVAHRVHGANVVNHAVLETHGQRLALGQHVLDAFVRGVAAGQHLAVEQQGLAGFPGGDLLGGQGVEVHALALFGVGRPAHVGPQVQRRRFQIGGTGAVEHKVRVAGGGAVGDHGHGLADRVRGVHLDFDVEHGGQATQALRANAQGVDLVVEIQAQLFNLVELLALAGFFEQLVHVQVVHQAFFGQEHGFFGGAADADAQHAGWAPASAHGGHGFEHPVDDAVAGVEHDQLGLVLAAAAFGRHGDVHMVARHDLGEDHGGCVVFGVFAVEVGVRHDGGTQRVVRLVVATAHTFVDGVFQAAGETVELHVHAHFQEHVDDAGVLANRAVPDGAHLAVGQDLCNGVLGGRALLAGIGAGQVRNEVGGVVVADVLQGGGDRFNQVVLFDEGGHGSILLKSGQR